VNELDEKEGDRQARWLGRTNSTPAPGGAWFSGRTSALLGRCAWPGASPAVASAAPALTTPRVTWMDGAWQGDEEEEEQEEGPPPAPATQEERKRRIQEVAQEAAEAEAAAEEQREQRRRKLAVVAEQARQAEEVCIFVLPL
jgi:hypothetical protein